MYIMYLHSVCQTGTRWRYAVLNIHLLSQNKDSTKTERKLTTVKGHVTLRYSV